MKHFVILLLAFICLHTNAQQNLIFNGDFTQRTEIFYSMDGGDVHRNLLGWDEINTPDYWGRDTVDGKSDFVVMILSLHHIEMITNRLQESLVPGCEYEFSFLAYTKNKKHIPVTLLFPNDTDIVQNQIDVYRLTNKRQVVKVKPDKSSDNSNDDHWKLYSGRFIANSKHTRIIIGNTLYERSNTYSTRIADLKLYSIKVCKNNSEKTIQFKK